MVPGVILRVRSDEHRIPDQTCRMNKVTTISEQLVSCADAEPIVNAEVIEPSAKSLAHAGERRLCFRSFGRTVS
jgi:hypothetical protein